MKTITVDRWIAYDRLDSPVGPLFAACTSEGLCALSFGDRAEDAAAELADRAEEVRRYPEALLALRRQLDEYFAGRRRVFELEVDLRHTTGFVRAVLEETARIPHGAVRSYGEVAAAVGKPGAARAVGQALNRNPVAIVVPCHRVVGSSGDLVGFGGGLDRKRALLELENVRWPGSPSPNASSS